jgi:hypothetical protein
MIKKITLLFFTLCTSFIFAQTTIGDSDLFNTTSNAIWTHVFTATRISDDFAVSSAAQTLVININSLPDGSTYRVLKTTFKSLEGFQTFYPGTKITLEKILRYHFYTAIHINQKENKLFSMDLTEFKLRNNTSEEEITKETVALIGDMFFGSNELKVIPIKN